VFDASVAGYWLAEVQEPITATSWFGLPPAAPGEERYNWHTTPTLAFAASLGCGIWVKEAYTWPQSHRFLEPWYKRLRGARAALAGPDPDLPTLIARSAVKDVYTVTIGWLAGSVRGWDRSNDDLFRPDWRDFVIAQARVNLQRNVLRCVSRGFAPWLVAADCMYFATDEPDAEAFAAMADIPLGDTLRDFSIKERAIPLAEIADLADGHRHANELQTFLNQRRRLVPS